ncbi:hypothetical protein, partial [Corynebacterium diphtheriae]|uniref:hypothetical protein n=1 Tax=Corynebacterium diphtheriae TaxID=1717 RepID=UPI001EE713BF
ETSHQPTSRGLPRPIRGLLVNQAPRTQTIGHSLLELGIESGITPEELFQAVLDKLTSRNH